MFRIFVGSLLFAVTPYWTFGIVLLLYSVNLIVFKATGHNWTSVLYSYTSLVFPSGYTKLLGDSPNRNFQHVVSLQRSGQSTTEVKRARLNQEQLLKQCRISFGLFSLFNLMCLIVYIGKIILHIAQCENFMIFPSLRFYVKSILEILQVKNLPF